MGSAPGRLHAVPATGRSHNVCDGCLARTPAGTCPRGLDPTDFAANRSSPARWASLVASALATNGTGRCLGGPVRLLPAANITLSSPLDSGRTRSSAPLLGCEPPRSSSLCAEREGAERPQSGLRAADPDRNTHATGSRIPLAPTFWR